MRDNDLEKTIDATEVEEDKTLLEADETVAEEKTLAPLNAPIGENADLAPNTLIGDGYTVIDLLAAKTPSGQAALYRVSKEGKLYVAKVYYPGCHGAEDKVRAILKGASCPYLVPIVADGALADGRLYEITPFYRQGSLEKHRGPAIAPMLKTFIDEINEALHALHELDLIHGDVKPQNVFLSDDGQHVALGDYDICRFLNGRDNIKNDRRMTPKYAAPECTNVPSLVMKASDLYSFGMTLRYISHARDEYFDDLNTEDIAELRAAGALTLPVDIDPDVRDLIYMLTMPVAKDRASYAKVKAWLKDPGLFRGVSGTVRFGENNPNIPSFEFNGHLATTLFDLAKALDSDWNKLRNVLSAEAPSGEFLLVDHLYQAKLQGTAMDVKAILSSKKPFYNKVFLVLHTLYPGIGFTVFGTHFPSLRAFFDDVYAGPSVKLMPAMFRYEILAQQAKDEGNDALIGELDKLAAYFPGLNDEEWADLVLNYFRTEDCFYLHLRKMDFSKALYAMAQNPPGFVKSRARFLQGLLGKQGKISQTLAKEVFTSAQGEDDARFLKRLIFAVTGELEIAGPSSKVRNGADFIKAANASYEAGGPNVIQSLANLLQDNGDFFLLLSLEGKGKDGAGEQILREVKSVLLAHRPAKLYFLTAEHPAFLGCKSMDEIVELALSRKDPEAFFASIRQDPAFRMFAERFVKLK